MQQSYGGIIRRQQHLIRCLATNLLTNKNTIKMQSVMSMSGNPNLEVDAVTILRLISPKLDSTKHKGQAGEISISQIHTKVFIFILFLDIKFNLFGLISLFCSAYLLA